MTTPISMLHLGEIHLRNIKQSGKLAPFLVEMVSVLQQDPNIKQFKCKRNLNIFKKGQKKEKTSTNYPFLITFSGDLLRNRDLMRCVDLWQVQEYWLCIFFCLCYLIFNAQPIITWYFFTPSSSLLSSWKRTSLIA